LQKREAYAQHPSVKPQHRPLSPATIATYVRSIKSFFAFLAREELIPTNRMATVKVPKTDEKVMPILTENEIGKLLHQS
jgi:site-specific recombinase XerD